MTLLACAAFSRALLTPCRAMTERGLRVDDTLRQSRLVALTAEADRLQSEALPLIEAVKDRLQRPELSRKQKVCKSCRNGAKKRQTCAACGGEGKKVSVQYNLGSASQLKDILYNACKLPRRTNRDNAGALTVDEEALQSLLPHDQSGLVRLALLYAKTDTMRQIYDRIEPARDGHIRTVHNPAGTYTFRFNSSEAFYVEHSTNLQNLPNAEAKRDALYNVRDCVVPDAGEYLLEADLSAADTWSVAALSEDAGLLGMLQAGADIHTFTAANMLGCPEAAVTKVQRDVIGKVTRHAGSFGEGWNSLMRRVNGMADLTGLTATAKQAKEWTNNFQALHPNLDTVWWNRVERTLLAGKPIVAFTGQTCYFHAPTAVGELEYRQHFPAALRAAIAWEPQYNTSMLAKMALLQMFRAEGGDWRVLLDNHDAVLIGVKHHAVWRAARSLKAAMEREIVVNQHALTIPCEVFVAKERWSEKERLL